MQMKNCFFLVTFLVIFCMSLKAGSLSNDRNSFSSSSKDGRFMVGLKGGLTFAQPLVFQKFNILSPLDNTISQSGIKRYKPFFQNIGYQYAFTALYQINSSIDIRFEPAFTTYVYKYSSAYFWESTGTNSERIDMSIRHQQSLKYIEFPLTLRFLYGSGNARPFIQGGIFYSYLLNAIKSFKREESYTNSLGVSTLNSESENGDASPLYIKSRYGINAGIGIDYDLTSVHLTFDINLNIGINSVTNQAARYSAQQFSGGLYDVQDNIRLLIPSVNIGILFPLHKSARSKINCPAKS
jgi:hypothetical protein